jgi:hypothetical protein
VQQHAPAPAACHRVRGSSNSILMCNPFIGISMHCHGRRELQGISDRGCNRQRLESSQSSTQGRSSHGDQRIIDDRISERLNDEFYKHSRR